MARQELAQDPFDFSRPWKMSTEIDTSPPASEKQIEYLLQLARERGLSIETSGMTIVSASAKIDELLATPRVEGAGPDLRDLESATYTPPSLEAERVMLRIDVVTQGRWSGWVFVRNGSMYDPNPERYGGQPSDSDHYSGRYAEELHEVVADPFEARLAYGRITGLCARCNALLENPESVARGVGPTCAGIWGIQS